MHRATVQVGPFVVDDLDREAVVDVAIELADQKRLGAARAYALHVGGLNHRREAEFVGAMNAAELVYADGGSIVGLARLGGAEKVERSPTTDLGWDLLRAFERRHGRVPRLALIGGHPGLAQDAGRVLEAAAVGQLVFACDGFQSSWEDAVSRVGEADTDICIVGMGAPREMLWTQRWHGELGCSLVVTCGGWFGFLTGEERRAPTVLRRSGLEWIARVAQSPKRLGGRYARGALSTTVVGAQIIRGKWGT